MTAPVFVSPAWSAVRESARKLAATQLRDLFAADAERFTTFSAEADGMLLDFSKQRIDRETLGHLLALWAAADGPSWQARMAGGDLINHTERRAVFHMALRHHDEAPVRVCCEYCMPAVREVVAKMERFCADIHGRHWRGATGEPITDVVNIGIGGSDLGPRMATRALAAFRHPGVAVHYVANLDGSDLAGVLASLSPANTLFIVASKTFTTQETMQNARSARQWLVGALGEAAVPMHFVAVSTNLAEVAKFGIDPENAFAFWDWVGGRFSLWSAIGLPLALAVGFANFRRFLEGGAAMDRHFLSVAPAANLPILLALLEVWNTDALGAGTRALLPYSQSLELMPRYLQQLEMESNGKQVDRSGGPVGDATAPVLWGEAGTNGQHAFYQLIHQGGRLIPCEFVALARPDFPLPGHHEKLLANCFAQSEALMRGKTLEEARKELAASGMPADQVAFLAPYKVFPGNQPSTTLVLPHLDPFTLGQLIALYEHKVAALGALWHVNSFDQWGVEYGKQLANRLLPVIEGRQEAAGLDASTAGLVDWVRRQRP